MRVQTERETNMAFINIANLKAPKAPNLPIPPTTYNQTYFEALTNVLRLYFNQIDLLTRTIITPDLGYFLNQPYAGFYDTTTQTAVAFDTAYPITFDTQYQADAPHVTGLTSDIFINHTDSDSKIIFLFPGVYNITYMVQPTSVAADFDTYFWLRQNGTTDVVGSSTKCQTVSGYTLTPITINAVVEVLTSAEYVELVWAVSSKGSGVSTNVSLVPSAATAFSPAAPSALLTVTYASA